MPDRFTVSIDTVLFDLDGTLVDTAPDMGYALNALLREYEREPLAAAAIRPYVSHGARGLIFLGFGEEPEGERFEEYRSRFLALYEKRICADSRLFEGMNGVIDYLDERKMPWGIVTNKPHYLTQALLEELNLHHRVASVVSGDTVAERKPHPAPLLHACRQLQRAPEVCVYIGDAQRDIEAGTRAGMATLVALFGYLNELDKPLEWGPTGLLERPADIIDWVA
ncbi:MAG: N-acetylmuramic acid 6-phosphate phosphatase [Gammaproteobacteria bacterium]|nr:N-acetylmuramic acid 6-phosphate phosphatase [Gammaproteobacteria bacterium]